MLTKPFMPLKRLETTEKLFLVQTLEMKIPSSERSMGPAGTFLAPPFMLIPSFSPGALIITYSWKKKVPLVTTYYYYKSIICIYKTV